MGDILQVKVANTGKEELCLRAGFQSSQEIAKARRARMG
jgi:hypothetical protein